MIYQIMNHLETITNKTLILNRSHMNTWIDVNGSGNAYSGFIELSVQEDNDGIVKVSINTHPATHYDCFNPNPYFAIKQCVTLADAKDAITKVMEQTNNLTKGLVTVKF